MDIVQFMEVTEAVIRKNVEMARRGRSPKDYLVPMGWGDPGLGKTDVVAHVAEVLRDLGRELPWGDKSDGWELICIVANNVGYLKREVPRQQRKRPKLESRSGEPD